MYTVVWGKRQAGFTLTELMIVLVIAGVLLALAAPGFRDLLESNRLQTGADRLYTSLILTRSEAIKRNQPVVMCKKNSGGTACDNSVEWEAGWLIYADIDGDDAPDPNEIIRVHEGLVSNDTLRVTGSDFDDEVTYRTDGSTSGSGIFVLCNSDADTTTAREIIISVTGRPRVNKTTADCTP